MSEVVRSSRRVLISAVPFYENDEMTIRGSSCQASPVARDHEHQLPILLSIPVENGVLGDRVIVGHQGVEWR